MDQEAGLSRVRVNTPTRSDERSIEQIRQDIEKTRNEITETVDQLGDKFKETLDWKHYISEYPLVAVGGVSVIGFLIARKVLGKKRSNTDELVKNLIVTATDALKPPKKSIFATVLAFGAKYVYDKYQEHQEEQTRQLELQQQLEQLQAFQQMQENLGTQTSGYRGSEL